MEHTRKVEGGLVDTEMDVLISHLQLAKEDRPCLTGINETDFKGCYLDENHAIQLLR